MENQDLNDRISEISKFSKEHKDIDVASLMLNALQQTDTNLVSKKAKRIAFLVSLGFPPVGLIFALVYAFSDKKDGKQVAWICCALTALSLVFLYIFIKSFASSTGVNLEQLKEIKPQDVQQLLE